MEYLFLGLVIVAIFYVISLYNGLVQNRNRYKNAFAQIDVQLTRRHDLIPNLVETVKGYIKHERETLEAVITARNTAVAGLNPWGKGFSPSRLRGRRRAGRRRLRPGRGNGLP